MRISRALGAATAMAVTLATGAALAAGPWPGLAPSINSSTGVSYSAKPKAGITTVRATRNGRVIATVKIAGAFGIPAVTTFGAPGGLSPNGRLLVLSQPPTYKGLRKESRFLLLSTRTLSTVSTIALPGEFGFDAISPDGRTLYLIQHTTQSDLVRYVVRAYDLRTKRLLPGAIVDKRNLDETMRGYPVARATSSYGSWVYTLYTKGPNSSEAFVHALNAAGRYALCVDLEWPAGPNIWDSRLELHGRTLFVVAKDRATIARIDTRTLRVI